MANGAHRNWPTAAVTIGFAALLVLVFVATTPIMVAKRTVPSHPSSVSTVSRTPVTTTTHNDALHGTSMWLWNWTDSASVVAFARAHGVTQIFAYAAPGFLNPSMVPPQWTVPELPLLRSLIAKAHTADISVEAMGGDPSWVTDSTVATAWAHDVAISHMFTGAHLDLEAWQLPTWAANQQALLTDQVATTQFVRSALGSVSLEVSIPWWLSQYHNSAGASYDTLLMHDASSVTIVTYLNTAPQVDSSALAEEHDASSLGVSYHIGVMVDQATPAWTSFYGTSAKSFMQSVSSIDAANVNQAGFLGVSVEDYTGWVALPAR